MCRLDAELPRAAFCSFILFLYKEVLNQQLGWLDGFDRAKRPARLPVVLSPAEVRAVLAHLDG